MPKTVVLGSARTPFGKLGGALSSLDATDLGARAVEAALEIERARERIQANAYAALVFWSLFRELALALDPAPSGSTGSTRAAAPQGRSERAPA